MTNKNIKENSEKYYLGLDIGTDSVGYAVTDPSYHLLKHKGEPMWGTCIVDVAKSCADRRKNRNTRRRYDRRKQRILWVQSLFAREIAKIDPKFYIRIQESMLYAEDATAPKGLFCDSNYKDRDYYREYPTIHHLIVSLMEEDKPHDIRLVYLACAWLVAHRGHFFSDLSAENIQSNDGFESAYEKLLNYLRDDARVSKDMLEVWEKIDKNELCRILCSKCSKNDKNNALKKLFPKESLKDLDVEPGDVSIECILTLLSGGKCGMDKLFHEEDFKKINVSLRDLSDEDYMNILSEIGDCAELLQYLKAIYDWVSLRDMLRGSKTISHVKVEQYKQHQIDLKLLKAFVKKYIPEQYQSIFREPGKGYSAYIGIKKIEDKEKLEEKKQEEVLEKSEKKSKTNKKQEDGFLGELKKIIEKITPDVEDRTFYDDMKQRLENHTFLPKQVTGDNRILPHQLYLVELERILENASKYLLFLNGTDAKGYVTKDKICKVFLHRIPYYVGPLNPTSEHSWVVRKNGDINPWNFDEMIDHDQSEEEFIKHMTNTCTYILEEPVLPKQSLLYQSYTVLNEVNAITINHNRLSKEAKQTLYTEVFQRHARVTVKMIKDCLLGFGYLKEDLETLAGIDTKNIKASLSSFIEFKPWLESGQLTESEVEKIIKRATYTENQDRLKNWIKKEFPKKLTEDDVKKIASKKFKDFGRLSRKFLLETYGTKTTEPNEVGCSIIHALWENNCNLMELLSDQYTYQTSIKEEYGDNKPFNRETLDKMLKDMYVSNAVKRPIYRVMEIVSDVVKIMGNAPDKIFVEMARGEKPSEKGKVTVSRYAQLKAHYDEINSEETSALQKELDERGGENYHGLNKDLVYLYFMQLGKDMYKGEPIVLNTLLTTNQYNKDHIYPQSKVKDDSVLNNLILVKSEDNGKKKEIYPIDFSIQQKMGGYWKYLHDQKLITDEKYYRLTRTTPFSEDEKWGFINRQLVETRQSTKVITKIFEWKYPKSEVVYVKAGAVSDFRKEFNTLKCRSINDLHHAKDAYLNIVVGNINHERFTKNWFYEHADDYSIKPEVVYNTTFHNKKGELICERLKTIDLVKKTMQNNHVHFTIYSYCDNGSLFDMTLLPKQNNTALIPRKKNLPVEKYGGYNKPSGSFFVLVKYTIEIPQRKKVKTETDVLFVPVLLMYREKYVSDEQFRQIYLRRQIAAMLGKEESNITEIMLPFGNRIIKIKTMLELDGYRMCITGRNGNQILLSSMMPLMLSNVWEQYCKRLESFCEKEEHQSRTEEEIAIYDKITRDENIKLYQIFMEKLQTAYAKRPNNTMKLLEKNQDRFKTLRVSEQTACLMQIIKIFNRINSGVDLTILDGGSKYSAISRISFKLTNSKKEYKDIRIIDTSASGLYETRSQNLIDLL